MQRLPLFLLVLALVVGCQRSADVPAVDRTTIKVDAEGFIAWQEAKRLILSGETTSVARTHAGIVYITLKDGTSHKSREAGGESAWRLIQDNGLQDKISFATE